MQRKDVEQMLLELTDEFTCRFGPEYTDRKLHHPECKHYLLPNIDIIRNLLAERDAAYRAGGCGERHPLPADPGQARMPTDKLRN